MKWFNILGLTLLFFACGTNEQNTTKETVKESVKESAQNSIKVGLVLPMTGGQATLGQENNNGIKLALEKIHKSSKFKFETYLEDDKSEALEATNAIRKLININKVNAIIGEATSTNSLAMAPIAQAAKIPMFSPSATNVKVTQTGNFISRACFTDDFQGLVMAKFAIENLNLKSGLILTDKSADYSIGLSKSFKEEFLRLGGKLATDEELTYIQKDIDFQTILRKVLRANPDVIFIPGYYTEVGLIIKQARSLGINAVICGGDGLDSPKLFEIAGDAVKGIYVSSHFAPDDKDPAVQAFVAEYEKEFKIKPGAMAALGYDSMGILADAVARAKSTSSVDINAALIATKDYVGITGIITIDENRNSKKPVVVLETTTKEFIFKAKVNP